MPASSPAQRHPGLLMRLLRDRRAATLPMMAAAVLPLAGMVGGALDMSRLYLVKTRLQQACDAGALSARRSMAGNAVAADTDAKKQGDDFFKANLRSGAYGARDVTFALSDVIANGAATGRVAGRATATVKPALMQLFNVGPITMTANCTAELNVTNTDVMFVLDLTGSMACLPSDDANTCVTWGNSNRRWDAVNNRPYTTLKPGSRLAGLQDAVIAFHATLSDAIRENTELRFGFVPYSSNVNVADVIPDAALRTGAYSYQSRVANMTTTVWRPTTGAYGAWSPNEQFAYNINWANCQNYGNNIGFTQTISGVNRTFAPNPAGNPAPASPTDDVVGGGNPADVVSTQFERVSPNASYTGDRTCVRRKRSRTTTYAASGYAFTSWTYRPVTYTLADDTMSLVETVPAGGRVTASGSYNAQELAQRQAAGTASGLTVVTRSADGCIEERETGMDDIAGLANTDATRWARSSKWLTYLRAAAANELNTSTERARPGLPAAGVAPTGGLGLSYSCTKASQNLQAMDATAVDAFVHDPAFVAMGYTYHDIGMIWGARLMAKNGIMAATHADASNGRPRQRHIIFMTDGDMDPDLAIYTPYGVEKLSKRRLGSTALTDANQKAVHNTAFLNACAAARGDGITVWVVAFGQSLTQELRDCAADTTHTFESKDTPTLTAQFEQIATRIAELRLQQ